MKNKYILSALTGASLMLALFVFTGADDDDFKWEIKYGHKGIPQFLFDKETANLYAVDRDNGTYRQIQKLK
jgi:hypothetical protein